MPRSWQPPLTIRGVIGAVCAEARRRGQRRITVLWVPHANGPEQFYLRVGFRPTGETLHGQVLGERLLT
ncbi:GNAT family N-acetyltransferase [Streptomyces harbinensis]|uniref:hypothetical protein n=1 Tax=Streptomyces harbinensis TaxID=1176198 RepID=UPI00368A1A81